MMGTILLVVMAILFRGELCQALPSDITGCPQNQCLGRQGKRGPPGIQGPRGLKGDKGDQGTCDGLMERQAQFEDEMSQRFDLISNLFTERDSKIQNSESRIEELQSSLNKAERRVDELASSACRMCPLGMESREIPNSRITASSAHDHYHIGAYARLDNAVDWRDNGIGAWCTKTLDARQWIQIDLGERKTVTGVITQGRPEHHVSYISSFTFACGDTPESLEVVRQSGQEKVYTGNDQSTAVNGKVTNIFTSPLSCRYVRLYPKTWFGHICLRMELLGECP